MAKYKKAEEVKPADRGVKEINVEDYFRNKGYPSNYLIAKQWTLRNTIEELLEYLKLRAYGLCWQVPEATFHQEIAAFQEFCVDH